MPDTMTQEQKDLFISIAQMGMTCGLDHPFEWLNNYIRHLPNFEVYEDIPGKQEAAEDAFIAFLKDTECQPDDPVANLDREGLYKMIGDCYEAERKRENVTLQQHEFEHLIRGGTLRHNAARGPVEIALADIGYVQMLEILKTAIADGEDRVRQVRRTGE